LQAVITSVTYFVSRVSSSTSSFDSSDSYFYSTDLSHETEASHQLQHQSPEHSCPESKNTPFAAQPQVSITADSGIVDVPLDVADPLSSIRRNGATNGATNNLHPCYSSARLMVPVSSTARFDHDFGGSL